MSVTLANDPGDLLEGVLVDPNGETPSVNTNACRHGERGCRCRTPWPTRRRAGGGTWSSCQTR